MTIIYVDMKGAAWAGERLDGPKDSGPGPRGDLGGLRKAGTPDLKHLRDLALRPDFAMLRDLILKL